jgi:hypothetical protein
VCVDLVPGDVGKFFCGFVEFVQVVEVVDVL